MITFIFIMVDRYVRTSSTLNNISHNFLKMTWLIFTLFNEGQPLISVMKYLFLIYFLVNILAHSYPLSWWLSWVHQKCVEKLRKVKGQAGNGIKGQSLKCYPFSCTYGFYDKRKTIEVKDHKRDHLTFVAILNTLFL